MADHPTRESFERLLAEMLSDEERTRVEAHVECCGDCQETLHNLTLDAAEALSPNFRPAQTSTILTPSDLQTHDFFERLKQMNSPASANPKRPRDPADEVGDLPHVEGYEVLEEVGRGAVGVVYRARHLKLNRLVALKVVVAGSHLSAAARQRFRLESLAIARLTHPNIVHVYDVGEHAGCPFLALEFVEGGDLSDWLAGKPRTASESARITAKLAEAVEYAHSQGVVHRDLKPANILLSFIPNRSAAPELKITDFGIARLLPSGDMTEARMTQTGEILGTPAYMAPEQARGDTSKINPATDVYSLGAMLYELLTGRPPFQGATPLDILMQATRRDAVSISLLVPRVPRDLDTICLKCLEKEPHQRYPTAAELAADLRRFLRNEPIKARPLSWAGHTMRWVRRHPGLAAALAGVAMLLIALTTVSLSASVYFRASEKKQTTLATEKTKLADEKERERGKAVSAEQRADTLRQQAENVGRELRQNLYFSQMNLAAQTATLPGAIGRVNEWLAPWSRGQTDLRNWEWYFLDSLCRRDLHTMYGHIGGVMCAAWSPDGNRVASGGIDNTVRLWNSSNAREIQILSGHTHHVIAVAWSPDGHRLASSSANGQVKIWNTDTCQLQLTFGMSDETIFAVTWSPDGKQVACAGRNHTIRIFDPRTGAVQIAFSSGESPVRGLSWSPDGKRLVSGDEHGDVQIWDSTTSKNLLRMHGQAGSINGVAWRPDGMQLASASTDNTVKIWDAESGTDRITLRGHTQSVVSVAWSPDGAHLATAGEDQTVKVWTASGGAELFTLRGHIRPLTSVAWSADGTHLVSASWDATAKIWNANAGPEVPLLAGHTGLVMGLSWSPDGRRLASSSGDTTIRIWDVAGTTELAVFRGHTDWVRSVAWSPNGSRIASAGTDHTIRIWNSSSGREINSIHVDAKDVYCVAWSPDSLRLASCDAGPRIHIWDPVSGRELQTCVGHENSVMAVAWSPDGKSLASGSHDRSVRVWDSATGGQIFSATAHLASVESVAWSYDGLRLASGSDDQTIVIWNAKLGRALTTLRGHTADVLSVAWSPDGTRVASASNDRTVKIWDSITGREAMSLNYPDMLKVVVWRPDGVALASGGDDPKIRIFDATAGYLAERAPQYLPQLDRYLAADPKNADGWRLRAEIDSRRDDWEEAATDVQHYLALNPDQRWLTLGSWVVGPYPDNLDATYSPEKDSDTGHPALGTGGVESPALLSWQVVPFTASGFVDFGSLFDHVEHISAYAQLRIYSSRQQPVAVLLRSPNKVRLWLNGEKLYENPNAPNAGPDDDFVPATLSAGWNTLLTRVTNVTGEHSLSLRLSNTTGDLNRVSKRSSK